MELKIRTKEQQMIDAFKKYIKTKGNVTLDYSLEAYMQVALDHISSLEKENRELNKENDRLAAKLNKNKILQNEFRKWLENKIKRYRKTLSERPTNDLEYNNYKVTDVALEQIKIVLSKYKEIIGDKE